MPKSRRRSPRRRTRGSARKNSGNDPRPTTDREFRDFVNGFSRSSMVRMCAALASHFNTQDKWLNSPAQKYLPWYLAEITRTSLAYGRTLGNTATESDVLLACDMLSGLDDPDLDDTRESLGRMMMRSTMEQFPFQLVNINEFSRSRAIFELTTPRKPMTVVVGGWDTEVFGCDLNAYLTAAAFAYGVAAKNGGAINLTAKSFEGTGIGADRGRALLTILTDEFAIEPDEFARRQAELDVSHPPKHPEFRRLGFSPLNDRPLVAGLGPAYVVPASTLLIKKASPMGIFYSAMSVLGDVRGNQFSTDLGELFEAYVGRVLEESAPEQLLPEITYDKGQRRAADWISVYADAVLIVECKATRPIEDYRLGSPEGLEHMKTRVEKGIDQLDETARLIRDRHPSFALVPSDRPIVGLVVTMEPFFIANSSLLEVKKAEEMPALICSVAELEEVVNIQFGPSFGQALHQYINTDDNANSGIKGLGRGHSKATLRVLTEAFPALP